MSFVACLHFLVVSTVGILTLSLRRVIVLSYEMCAAALLKEQRLEAVLVVFATEFLCRRTRLIRARIQARFDLRRSGESRECLERLLKKLEEVQEVERTRATVEAACSRPEDVAGSPHAAVDSMSRTQTIFKSFSNWEGFEGCGVFLERSTRFVGQTMEHAFEAPETEIHLVEKACSRATVAGGFGSPFQAVPVRIALFAVGV